MAIEKLDGDDFRRVGRTDFIRKGLDKMWALLVALSSLGSKSHGEGASLVAIEDAGGKFDSETVEGAMQEVGDVLADAEAAQEAAETAQGLAEAAQEAAEAAQEASESAKADAEAAQAAAEGAQGSAEAAQAAAEGAQADAETAQGSAEAAQAAAEAAQALAEAAATDASGHEADAEAAAAAALAAAQETVDAATTALKIEKNAGVIQAFRLLLPEQPADHNTIGVGADTVEFLDPLGNLHVTDPANIAVLIGADDDETRDNLVAAVNATDGDNRHASALKSDGGGGWIPALANCTEPFVAENVTADDAVEYQGADEAGGTPTPGSHSAVLAESVTHASDIWDCGNVNVNTLGGEAAAVRQVSRPSVTLTQAMLDAGAFRLVFPFAVRGWMMQVRSAAGAEVIRDEPPAMDVTARRLEFTFADGGGDNFDASDVVTVEAWD